METVNKNNNLLKLLGISLFTQAVTSLVGGMIFSGPFDNNEITGDKLISMAQNNTTIYISIIFQLITAVVIIILGVSMFRLAGHINKTMAILALSFYIFEAMLLTVDQVFIFGLSEASQLFISTGEMSLISLGSVLMASREFAGKIAMIPFGLGALLFYYLLMKASIIPKWLALWGLITVPFILVGIPLIVFGVSIPFAFFVPYVPFEFFTGIFILVKYRKKIIA